MLGLTSVCVFLFSALALAVNSGYSLGALVLLLASSWLLWKRPRLHLQRRDYLLMGVMLADAEGGAKVAQVVPESPAEKAKLQVDDLITEINGKAVDSREELVGTVRKFAEEHHVLVLE